MTFLNPLLLAGTALVAVPIVLHLIMRRKPQHLEFPALQFVQTRHETNQRRLRLRHLLLLLLRAGAIAILAFALARPSMKLSGVFGSRETPVAAALVFDTSPRMEYRHKNVTRLEAAKGLGLWLLAQLPRDSQIAVFDTRLGPGVFQVDHGAAKQRIERLDVVANSQALTSVLDEVLQLLGRSDLARKEVYVFSDLARTAWPADSAGQLRDRAGDVPGVGVYVIDVGVEDPTDFALGEVRLSGQVLSSRSPLEVQTDLTHTGPGGARTVELYLLGADRKPQKRSQQSVTLESNASQQVEFTTGALEVGTHQGLVQIVGQDALGCDDTRFFTVEVKPAWPVLVAAPKPAERYALFLTQALAPASFRRTGQARFDCRVITLDELSGQNLESYAAVCLLDPTPLEPAVWQKLADFASDGQGVAIFLGRNARPIDSFNQSKAQELLPGKLVRQARRPDDSFLAPRDLQHPLLAAFRGHSDSVPWDAFPVYRYWQLDALHQGVHVVVPFTDGRPAILERPLGSGRVLTMTTPVSDRPDQTPWNLLPVGNSWPFVILANQMMSYLVGSGDRQLNYYAGQTAVVPLAPQRRRQSYLLTTPAGIKFRLSSDPKEDVLVVSSADQPGNYRIRAGGRESGVDCGFSVNLAPEQTRLARLTNDELAEVFGPMEYRVAQNRNQIERDQQHGRVGQELFPLLIALVALMLGLEYFVANRFYRK